MGAMVPLKDGDDDTLVQTVAFSFKINEVGGADENLAAFRSDDAGKSFKFQQVVALKNQTMPPSKGGKPAAYLHYIHDCMNGTVYRTLQANESSCQAACSTAGSGCAAFAMPLGPAADKCHLLKEPLVSYS